MLKGTNKQKKGINRLLTKTKAVWVIFMLVSTSYPIASIVGADAPEALMRAKIQLVKDIIGALPTNFTDKDEKESQDKIRKELEPLFSEAKSSELSISADYWSKFTPEQKTEYKKLLRQIIVKKFTASYKSEKGKHGQNSVQKLKEKQVQILKEVSAPDKLLKVNESRQVYAMLPGDELDIPIKFMFYSEAGTWKIYDIHFDGKSMIFSYRKQFRVILQKYGVKGLLERLRKIAAKK